MKCVSDADRHVERRHVKSVFAAPSELRISRVACGYKHGERKCQSDVGGIRYGEKKQPRADDGKAASSIDEMIPFLSSRVENGDSRNIPWYLDL